MKILHYFLGFPPYRTGGLTKYVSDLMDVQLKDGHIVIALWPGEMRKIGGNPVIRYRSDVNGIVNCEIVNPLPVPLDEGICAVESYTQSCDKRIYEEFLGKLAPSVIHIHTLMGLHKEFVEAAQKAGIRTVFTTHDYFGICPKVTLYRYGDVCECYHDGRDCIQCNAKALSLRKIQIMQSPLYRMLKNSYIVKWLRKQHREVFFADEMVPTIQDASMDDMAEQYRKLRRYYIDILEHIDIIHFNSSVSESVYKKYMVPKVGKVITITHRNIADNRDKICWSYGERLRITCLAPAKPYKGFTVLKKALDEIWDSGNHDFELKLFGAVSDPSPYMRITEGGFQYDQLGEIMADTDILVAPSIWYETFGFTVLEAISYGVPVVVSDHVGAKDIVGAGGIVVGAGDVEHLKNVLENLSKEKIQIYRDNILAHAVIKEWNSFVEENYMLYKE